MCSLSDALNSLFQSDCENHESDSENIRKITFNITSELEDKRFNEASFKSHFKKIGSVLFIFDATLFNGECKIVWKLTEEEKFYFLRISEDPEGTVAKYCVDFIEILLKTGNNGVLKRFQVKQILEIRDLACINGRNILINAVSENRVDLVDKLLKYDFDVDLTDDDDLSAIDEAWRNFINPQHSGTKDKISKVILSLLNANSKYPVNFSYDRALDEVKNFVDKCKELNDNLKANNFELFREKIQKMPQLRYFYDQNNQSLMAKALKSFNAKAYNQLYSLGLIIAPHEFENLQGEFQNAEKQRLIKFRNLNRETAMEPTSIYILELYIKSKIGNNLQDYNGKFEKIMDAYKIIDKNIGCRKVLKVAAACKRIKIFFDFKHDSTYYFDPVTSLGTSGITYGSGVIEIGAKDLIDKEKKFEVIGVLIHELCHLAFYITYMNTFNPYQMGESEDKTRFEEEVKVECEENQEFEEIVGSVFRNYEELQYNLELVVRPYHLMMHYYEHPKRIAECEAVYSQLFNYVREVVEPQLEKALPVLKRLQDDVQKVKFSDLTEPMKAKILNSKIKFQGEETSLFEIIGNDEAILKLLKPSQIKDILLDIKDFEFGDICVPKGEYEFVERKFVKYQLENERKRHKNHFFSDRFSFDDIKSIAEKLKGLVLTGRAGDGKTRAFEEITKNLKSSNKSFWVSYVKLRQYRDIFEGNCSDQELSIESIIELFCQILFSSNSKFEIAIFKKLFLNGNVVLLLDGVDEICPKFNELIVELVKILKTESKIQVWVSTRPQHVEQFEKIDNIKTFTFEDYEYFEITKLIEDILKKSNKFHQSKNKIILKSLHKLLNHYENLTNPLFIIMVTELFLKRKIDLNSEFKDIYGIYEKVIDEQIAKKEVDVDQEDRKISLNFFKMWQVLALKFMFEQDKIKDLSIIQKWQVEKRNWTAEKIQRFGIVIVDLDFLKTDKRSSIDFIHFTYAEFFVAQFIIKNVFNDEISDKIIERIFNILKSRKQRWIRNSILENYLENSANLKDKILHPKMKDLVIIEIENQIVEQKYDCDSLKNMLNFWFLFMPNKQEIMKEVWLGGEKKNLFKNSIIDNADLNKVFDLVEYCFGKNWDSILYECNKNLLLNDNEDDIDLNESGVKNRYELKNKVKLHKYFKNFYKLLNIVEKSFNAEEKMLLREKNIKALKFQIELLNENYYMKCFEKTLKIYKNDVEILSQILSCVLENARSLEHFDNFKNVLLNFFENDHENVQKFLFSENLMNIFINISFNNIKLLEFLVKLYDEFKNSMEEFQNFFLVKNYLLKIVTQIRNEVDSLYIKCLKKAFSTNKKQLCNHLSDCEFDCEISSLLKVEKFLINVLDNDVKLVKEEMRNILYNHKSIGVNKIREIGDSYEDFLETMKLVKRYQNSNDEFNEIFKSWKNLSQNFSEMSNKTYKGYKKVLEEFFKPDRKQIIECFENNYYNLQIIKSEVQFTLFEKFILEFLKKNKHDANTCIKNVLKSCFYDSDSIAIMLASEMSKFLVFEKNFTQYFSKEEFRENLIEKYIIFEAIFYVRGNAENQAEFVKFAKEFYDGSFPTVEETNFDFFKKLEIMENKKRFKNIESKLKLLYDNDEIKVRNFIRKILFSENINNFPFSNFHIFSRIDLQFLIEIYKKYQNSLEELQNGFINNEIDPKIFYCMSMEDYKLFKEFISDIFESNKNRLCKIKIKSVSYNSSKKGKTFFNDFQALVNLINEKNIQAQNIHENL